MKQRLLITAVITALLIIIAIPLINKEQVISPLPQTTIWEKVSTWAQADRQFPSHPEEPLLLYRDENLKKAIYIQDGVVRSLSLDNDQGEGTTLLNIDASEGYYWRNGNTLLLAAPIHQSNPDNYLRGEWYAIDIGDTEAIQPSILKVEDAIIDPRKLLTVTLVEDAELFLLVEGNDNVHFNEYFYAAGESRLMYVNLEIPRNEENYYTKHYLNNRPQATVDVQHFQKETPYHLADGSSIYAYEDDRGTLLVYHSGTDNYRHAVRYAGVKLIDVALKTDILGNAYPLIWTDGSIVNTASMSYLGNGTSLQPTEELLNDEWRMVNMRHFYRLDGDILRTIRFESSQGSHYSKPEHRTYELPGQPVDDHHGLLTLESNGVTRYLSVFDLLNGRGALNELWMQDLPVTITSSVGERAKEEWEILNEMALPEEIMDHVWKNEELPKEVSGASANQSWEECILDCGGDHYDIPQIRSIEDIWYVLIGESMYQVKDNKFVLLGKLPISTAFTHGEGSNGYTALDYTRIGTDWYVADTYGNRVIKVDEKFTIIAEHPLPTPSHIIINGKDELHVNSLKGITILDRSLIRIGEAKDIPIKVQSAKPSDQLLSEISHYIDKKLGIQWVYTGEGKLIIYIPKEKEYTTTFIGNPQSGRAIVRIFPYQDEVLILSDYRLLRFSPDGKWKSTIDFSKGAADGIYNKTPTGENSYVLDSANEQIYIVQGARIVAIDLPNDFAFTLFQQDYSEIGRLSLYKERLVFTLEGNPYYSLEESTEKSNELIVIHPMLGALYRYSLKSGWFSEGLDGQQTDQLNLWAFQDPNNRGWDQIYRGTLPLHRLIFPFAQKEISSITLEQQGSPQTQSTKVDPISMEAIIHQLFNLSTNPDHIARVPVRTKSNSMVNIVLHSQNDEYIYEYDFITNNLHHMQESVLMGDIFWRTVNRFVNPNSVIANIDKLLLEHSTHEMHRLHDRILSWEQASIEGKDYDLWEQWLEKEAKESIPYISPLTGEIEAIRWNKDVIQLDSEIYFISDLYSTKEGIKVGLTKEQVEQILGEPNRRTETGWGYLTGDFVTFWLYFEEGKVKYMKRSMPA